MYTKTSVSVGKTPERRYRTWADHRAQMTAWADESRAKHAPLVP
jgi:hypothetical protein